MELAEAISKFKADLEGVKKDGKTDVAIDNLEKYLDVLSAQATQSIEYRKLLHESNLAHYTATAAVNLENFRAVIDAGKEAINAAIIINGGAVIALMAFMGNIATKYGKEVIPHVATPLLAFGIGAFCGGIAFGTRYICQFFYAGAPNNKLIVTGHVFNAVSWLVTTAAFAAFVTGVFLGYSELVAFGTAH